MIALFHSRWRLLSRQELALILITMIWGGTFLVVREAMEVSGPFFFVGLRFATAGLAMWLLFGKTMRGLTIREMRGGQLNDSHFGSRMRGRGAYAAGIARTFEVFLQKLGLDAPWEPLDTSQFRPPELTSGQRRLF